MSLRIADIHLGGAYDCQIRRLGRAFKHYFGPTGREFEVRDAEVSI